MTQQRQLKVLSSNRKAFYEYEILDRVEAGLVLTGSEIKSIRNGRVNIAESYARPINKELWLVNAHIAQYPQAGIYNHEPSRFRKLLLKKDQLAALVLSANQKGLTIIPLRLYIRNHVAKLELGLARGKKQHDKRKAIAQRTADRDMQRAIRRHR